MTHFRHKQKKHQYTPIHNYLSYEDLLEKSGYRTHKPRLGTLGQALLKASNNLGQSSWLKSFWDGYFRNLRKEQRQRKQNKKNEIKNQ